MPTGGAMENEEIKRVEEGTSTSKNPTTGADRLGKCLSSSIVTLTQKVMAEVIGTYFLIFAGCGSVAINKIYGSVTFPGVCVTWGSIVMVMIYTVGHVSGAHFNPAVTITLAIFRRFPWWEVPIYVVSQMLGSVLASGTLSLMLDVTPKSYFGTVPSGSNGQSLVVEIIISFLLMFVVCGAVTDSRATSAMSGVAVGVTIMLNIFIAGPISGGSMNPARSLGPAIVRNVYTGIWVYIVGPIVGTIAGALAYDFMRSTNKNLDGLPKAVMGDSEANQSQSQFVNQSQPQSQFMNQSQPQFATDSFQTQAKFQPIAFSHSLPVKLNSKNFLLWRQQAISTIRGHKLAEFILKYDSAPEKFVDGSISQEYQNWDQQDQLLVSWLLGSVNQDILSHLIGCVTSYEVWQKLESLFSSTSQANVMQYKLDLNNLKKGGMPMQEYLLKVKNIVDALGYAGHVVNVSDYIMHILSGLGSEYDPFVMTVNAKVGKSDEYTVNEIQSLLLTFEKRLEKSHLEGLTVNMANAGNNNNRRNFGSENQRFDNRRGGFNGAGRFNGQGNRNGGRFSNQYGRGRGRTSQRPQCQLCLKFGHTVLNCYYRYDKSFQGPASSSSQQMNVFVTESHPQQSMRSLEQDQLSAFMASPDSFIDPGWVADSGATNHCTPTSSNLQARSDYHGMNQIYMGDGSGLNISGIGSSVQENSSSRTA